MNLLPLVLCQVMTGPPVMAESHTVTLDMPPAQTAAAYPIPQFDSLLGTLVAVEIAVEGVVGCTAEFDNAETLNGNFARPMATVEVFPGLGRNDPLFWSAETFIYNDEIPQSGPDIGVAHASQSSLLNGDFAPFIGDGSVTMMTEERATVMGYTSGGGVDLSVYDFGVNVEMTVTYLYLPNVFPMLAKEN
jgi:hypothetical protein